MKSQFKLSYYILALLFIVFTSCSEEDGNNENDSSNLFTIHASEVSNFSNDLLLMATSAVTGEVLYSDIGLSFDEDITFDAEGAETIDLTVGLEFGTAFNITTYRDIRSGFEVSGFLYPCYENQFDFNPLGNKNLEIILSGTTRIIEVINPLSNTRISEVDQQPNTEVINNILYDYDRNVTILRGVMGISSMDIQFAFRFAGEQDYESIIVSEQDWVSIDDENSNIEIDRSDLSPCNIHSIDVGVDLDWIVNSEVLTTNNERIRIAQWSTFTENQSGNSIKILLEEGLELDNLLLQLSSNNFRDGFEFQKTFSEIPTSIELTDFSNEIASLATDSYTITSSNQQDLLETSYLYSNNNVISTWNIYQTSNSSLSYTLPHILEEYLDQSELMKTSLPNPQEFSLRSYSTDTNINEAYNKTSIDRQLQCLDFTSSYKTSIF